jgi:hypothetical protein
MRIIKNEVITVRRYVNTNVKGTMHRSLVLESPADAAVMPVSPGETSDVAAEVSQLESSGRRLTDFKKVYTKYDIKIHDELLLKDGEYIVLRVYDYNEFGMNADHTKVVAVKIED